MYQKRSFWVKMVALALAALMVLGIVTGVIFSML